MKIDNQIALETAEGIDIELTPAGLGVRTLAFTYDFFLRALIYIAASIVLQYAGKFGQGIFFIVMFLVEWFYPVIFEITTGQTPGKKAFGLAVVYDNGLPVTLSGSLTRNLFRAVDFLPSFYMLGGICVVLSGQSKRIGDYLGGTLVVYRKKPVAISYFSFEKSQTGELQLDAVQQKAIIDFAERCKTLSPQRQQELAKILLPMLDCEPEQAVTKLKSWAANMVGKA